MTSAITSSPLTLLNFILLINNISGSKLERIVLRNANEIWTQNKRADTNITSGWNNEGFYLANSTKISQVMEGDKIDAKTKLLVATKASSLSTQLKNFNHTFLVMKFSWKIGHQNIPSPKTNSSTKSKSVVSVNENIPKHISMNVTESPLLFSTEVPPIGVWAESEPEDIVTIPATTPPKILKLSTKGTDESGHQVIEIAIDSGISADKVGAEVIIKKTASRRKRHVLRHNFGEEMSKVRRKRRALDSEEISQIHKLLTMTKEKKKDDPKMVDSVNVNDGSESIVPLLVVDESTKSETASIVQNKKPSQPVPPITTVLVDGSSKNVHKGKLPYETWKASLDKSYRPPGFYVLVDDKVVFDNWIGVWPTKNIMGTSLAPSKKEIWNETNIFIQYDEFPDQNIRINFDWEPTQGNTYLLLSNITIYTFGVNSTFDLATKTSPNVKKDDTFKSNDNHNITINIVVKTEEQIKTTSTTKPIPSTTMTTTKTTDPSTFSGKKQMTIIPGKPSSLETGTGKQKEQNYTGLIVACITGIFSFAILVFLIQKKLSLSRNSGC